MNSSTPIRHTHLATQHISATRADKGHAAAAIAAALTLILLFQPWLTASGPNGRLRSDAFGRIDGTTRGFGSWLSTGYSQPSISGVWAVLTALAAVVTITAVLLHLRLRTEVLSRLVPAATLTTAVFLLADLLYLNGKAPDLRAMVQGDNSFGTGLLSLFTGSGTGTYGARQVATAGLDPAALLAGATAVGGAVTAIATGLRKHAWYALRWVPPTQHPDALSPHRIRDERTVITVG